MYSKPVVEEKLNPFLCVLYQVQITQETNDIGQVFRSVWGTLKPSIHVKYCYSNFCQVGDQILSKLD